MGATESSHANAEFNTEQVPSQEPFQSGESVRGLKASPSDNDVTLVSLSEVLAITFIESESSDYDDSESESEDENEEDLEIETFWAERRMILEDAKMLKNYAVFHLHPERSVTNNDSFSFGRNFFDRYHAPEKETFDEAEERVSILEEMRELKKFATFHLHPELSIVTTDVNACGRNYFSRPSADNYFDEEEEEERTLILDECKALKKYAEYHLHPERPVVSSNSISGGRNYFERGSAPQQESVEDDNERAKILEETAMLKKYAEFHLHPEKPVVSSDSVACGRNYFSRPFADRYFDEEEEEERILILDECKALKKYAEYHLHPERPVVSSDPAACSRNYFCRPTAPLNEMPSEVSSRNSQGVLQGVLSNLPQTSLIQSTIKQSTNDGNKEEDSNMSRSPSSIMLFGYQDNEAF